MKEYGFHIIAFVCIVSLFVTACDKTIHQYPESEKTWVMVELNADRTPPVYYKELTYDAEGESSINDLEPVLSGNYTADERLCLRFVVELYKMPGATDDVNKGNLVERREISVERLTDAPQDTLYFCLADGIYKVLAWADYVPKEEPADWHFSTDKLDAVRANVSHKPLDNHHKNSAAGNCDFIVDSSRDDKAGPVRLSGNEASGAAVDGRMVSVYMSEPLAVFGYGLPIYKSLERKGVLWTICILKSYTSNMSVSDIMWEQKCPMLLSRLVQWKPLPRH